MPRAEYDVQSMFDFIQDASPNGAARWLTAFQQAMFRLPDNPSGYSLAPEDEYSERELRQFLFKTRHGLVYRGVFTVTVSEILILRVCGPGQAPVEPDFLG